jgi:hypothetical protein
MSDQLELLLAGTLALAATVAFIRAIRRSRLLSYALRSLKTALEEIRHGAGQVKGRVTEIGQHLDAGDTESARAVQTDVASDLAELEASCSEVVLHFEKHCMPQPTVVRRLLGSVRLRLRRTSG